MKNGSQVWFSGGGTSDITVEVIDSRIDSLDKDVQSKIYYECDHLISNLRNYISIEVLKHKDPQAREKNIDLLLAPFREYDKSIKYEEIENEYWGGGSPSSWLNPWLLVETEEGSIKVGWRKRVIVLDWSDCCGKTFTADFLFPNENVTKEKYMINCWGYDKLREYLKVLVDAHDNNLR